MTGLARAGALVLLLLSISCVTAEEEREAVRIRFAGLVTVDRGDLEDAAERELDSFGSHEETHVADLADAAYAMESWLRREGYAHAFVDFEVLPSEEAAEEVLFTVEEGPRARRESLEFVGIEALDVDRVRAFFEPPAEGFFEDDDELPIFRERDLDGGIGDLESLYLHEGYFAVEVHDPEIHWSEDRSLAAVTIRVDEGARHLVEAIDVVGALPAGFELDREPLEELVGGPYRARTAAEAAAIVRRQLEASGWLRARIRPRSDVDDEAARAHVRIRVDPGPRIIARALDIQGLDRTDEGFIRYVALGEIDLGTVLTQQEIDRARDLLLGSGLFRVARIELRVEGEEEERAQRRERREERMRRRAERMDAARRALEAELEGDAAPPSEAPVEDPGAEGVGESDAVVDGSPEGERGRRGRDEDDEDDEQDDAEARREAVEEREAVVEVLLEEVEARRVAFEAGFGSYELLRGAVRYTDLNLFGFGRELTAETSASLKSYDFEVRVSDPWIFGRDDVLEVGASFEFREEPSFTRSRIAADVTLRHRFDAKTTLRTGYFFEAELAEDIEPEDDPGFEDDGFVTSAGFFGRLIHDARDDPFVPTEGWRIESGLAWSSPFLGADLSYVALEFRGSTYWAIADGTVLGATFRVETRPILDDRDTLPIQERLFLGGDRTVRSFTQDQLGPKAEDGDALGGLTSFYGSIELRQRLWKELHGAVFWDAGTIGEDAFDFAGPYGHAIGVGLRYYTPIGPIRLDFGYNPFETFGEDAWAIHFALGFSF